MTALDVKLRGVAGPYQDARRGGRAVPWTVTYRTHGGAVHNLDFEDVVAARRTASRLRKQIKARA